MKKKSILLFIFIVLLVVVAFNIGSLTNKIAGLLENQPTVIINKPNEYYKETNYQYVSESEDFVPYSKQDLKNIFYSILNNGYDTFTFYCPSEYTDCLDDVNELSSDSTVLTHINNFVSPFNNFSSIKVTYTNSGEVNVEITKLYTDYDINIINNKIDDIMASIITDGMSLDDKILAIHDYIINNTKYDEERAEGDSTYNSNTAYGPLIEGYAVCGGYADAMALFLNRLGVPNFKIASDTHVWNAVYIDDQWLHLDLTWDDPVSENSETNTLLHKFYLITTEKLESYNIADHDFDKTVYQEMDY